VSHSRKWHSEVQKGRRCPTCNGKDTEYNGEGYVCLNEECGEQWDMNNYPQDQETTATGNLSEDER